MIKKILRILIPATILMLAVSLGYLAYTEQLPWLPFPAQQYANLLIELKQEGYSFVLPKDYNASNKAKTVLIFHDVDGLGGWQHGVNTLANVEQAQGVRSAFYLRPDMDYFTGAIPLFLELQQQGWEIGYHYDTYCRAGENLTLAWELFTAQIIYLRTWFNISTVRAHGDEFCSYKVDSHQAYDQALWGMLGVRDYTSLSASWVQDTHHVWSTSAKYGLLVVILLHADWW